MKHEAGSQFAPWAFAGVLLLALLVALAWHFRSDASPAQLLARKATRADLVGQIQVALATASEAEKSAVLALTDVDSEAFAAQARAASAEAENQRTELAASLGASGTPRERELLSQLTEALGGLRRVDEEVLSLAVKNTNLKAYALLYGPAAETLTAMDNALAEVAQAHAQEPQANRVLLLASEARLGVLRVQALLSPHIAEETDAKMDRLEAAMASEDTRTAKALATLGTLPTLRGDGQVAAAAASFARYRELEAQILALSRENTNVRSLSLSLNQKRKAMLLCTEALRALQEAILDEPIRGVTYGRPPSPR